MSNPNALFLLADHIKLSLLERKRAQALNLQSDSQDGHISRSLEQFRDGLEALQKEQQRLEDAGETTYVLHIRLGIRCWCYILMFRNFQSREHNDTTS